MSNQSTRDVAIDEIRSVLLDIITDGASILVGFDFPYGYPAGLGRALGLAGAPWRATWEYLAMNVRDDQSGEKRNNRFQVASSLNARLSGTGPFWGCPETEATRHLLPTGAKPEPFATFRITERGIRAQPTWKLYTSGSVGSQVILGLPRLHALRFDPTFASFSQVWPFDTGARLPARENGKARIVHAEIYPSMVRAVPTANQVKDEAQVIEQALQFARLDTTGRLAALFEVPSGLPTNDLAVIVAEEGWILGVTTPLGTCQR